MTQLEIHDVNSAPAASQPILEGAQRGLGFIPNLYGTMADAPAVLKGYTTLGSIFDTTSFTPTERQVVLLSVSVENECNYCVAAHTTIAGMQNVDSDAVEAIRSGSPLADPKLQALATFTREVVTSRGWASQEAVNAFLAAGYTHAQILEVVLGVGMKTISNYVNHVAETPLDEAFAPAAWRSTQKA